ncbi:MAG: hypothetical protein LBB51_04820 [Zoogloeaceae bacterium]|jgi:hypothetical protein|nr:hypothetical protein [Zoogloeaceae bacterium]
MDNASLEIISRLSKEIASGRAADEDKQQALDAWVDAFGVMNDPEGVLEIIADLSRSGITSGFAAGEAAQRALDAWIKAGAIIGDEHLYGLLRGSAG